METESETCFYMKTLYTSKCDLKGQCEEGKEKLRPQRICCRLYTDTSGIVTWTLDIDIEYGFS